jgi:ABC-type enterochelin transport system permease subunit
LTQGFGLRLRHFFISGLFYFLRLVLVALIYHSQNNVRNVITFCWSCGAVYDYLYHIICCFFDEFIKPSDFQRLCQFRLCRHTTINSVIIKLTVLLSAFVWTLIFLFKSLPDKNKNFRPSYFLIGLGCSIGAVS